MPRIGAITGIPTNVPTNARSATPRGSLRERRERKAAGHKGWLHKRGPCHDYEWDKRFCVLHEDEIVIYEDESEDPSKRKGEVLLNEYTKTVEFRKTDAPGEAAKHVKDKPFGFVVDTEPHAGKNRLSLYYFAADNNESMNQWIVHIFKACKQLKGLAPPNRTSLAEFVALWDAPLVLVSAPETGRDKSGITSYSVPAVCQSILSEAAARCRPADSSTGLSFGPMASLSANAVSWFTDSEEKAKDVAFPLDKYFSVAVDFNGGYGFCESRIRGVDGENVITGKNDSAVNFSAAYDGEWNEQTRQFLAIEHSFAFCHWRGMAVGALMQALVSAGDRVIPAVDQASDTKIGKMSQAEAQGIYIADPKKSKDTKASPTVRVVIAVTIDGGLKEYIQKSHIPAICKEVVVELKKEQYPWAKDAWLLWCHFPSGEDFLRSLSGCRNLVPDNNKSHHIRDDHADKPTTYTVHKFFRQPSAPSLLGSAKVEDILGNATQTLRVMVEGLLGASDSGDLRKVQSILDEKCDVNLRDDSGVTALSVAAGLGHTAIVKELVSRGADVNIADGEGDTALTVAVGEGMLDIVKILVENGADKDALVSGQWIDQPDSNITVLDLAKHRNFADIIAYLSPKAAAPSVVRPKKELPKSLADELAVND